MNSSSAINILQNDHPLYTDIVAECRSLLQELGVATPAQIFREKNAVADCLAKEGARIDYSPNLIVLTSVPTFATNVVVDDFNGKTFRRSINRSNINLQGRDVALNYSILAPISVRRND